MKRYRGVTRDDTPINGGEYIKKNQTGVEVKNFLPVRGRCNGYVTLQRGGTLNLERIGLEGDSDHVDGVTVVFCAKPPGGGRVVVGWYNNARVWRKGGSNPGDGEHQADAKLSDCVLLDPDDRVFKVPPARKGVWGLFRGNVHYLDKAEAVPFRDKLLRYINAQASQPMPPTKSGGNRRGPRQTDPDLRAKVERAARDQVVSHYESKGFKCVSVENDNVGWDLEMTKGKTLLVEVKGCSGPVAVVELTPNEFKKMKSVSHRDVYRVAIVTRALEKRLAKLFILSYNLADKSWRDEDNRKAKIRRLTGARIAVDH